MNATKRAPDTAATRLSRLLALVPWLSAHDGVTIDEAAAHFDVTPEQLQNDLWLLICTGRPGHMHGDLVDIQFWDEDGRITVVDAQTLDRPLRLSPDGPPRCSSRCGCSRRCPGRTTGWRWPAPPASSRRPPGRRSPLPTASR